jgi:hypothetical protein
MSWINAFAIAPGQDRPHDDGTPGDATGGFMYGARHFAKAFGCPWRTFKNQGKDKDVRPRFYEEIETHCPGGANLFAHFGHGLRDKLLSAGISMADVPELARRLDRKLGQVAFIVIYGCSAGQPGGLAEELQKKLGPDRWVYSHTSPKHTFKNPDVSEASAGRHRVLYSEGSNLWTEWTEALKRTDLWMRFPVMDDDQIDDELTARRLLGTWDVSGNGAVRHYVFNSPYRAMTPKTDLDAVPTGTVKAVDPKKHGAVIDEGTWEVSNVVEVTWKSGAKDRWVPPLQVVGQPVLTAANLLTAKRIHNPKDHGAFQG